MKNTAYDRFAFAHQNEPLLFQFILNECLMTLSKLQTFSSEESLFLIIGLKENHEISRRWDPHTGHLRWLYYYFTLFETHFNEKNTPLLKQFGASLKRALRLAQQYQITSSTFDPRAKSLLHLKVEVKKMIYLLLKKLFEYRANENVIFFLVRNHELIEKLCGKAKTSFLLVSLFPKGIKEISTFLVERYTKRGFHHLIPLIQQKTALLSL